MECNTNIDKYVKKDPAIVRIKNSLPKCEPPFSKIDEGKYALSSNRSICEATIICAGQIKYSAALSEAADYYDEFNFRGSFKHVRHCFENADLAIAGFDSLAADIYPPTELMDSRYSTVPYFKNARSSFLDAVRYGGIHCLAMASPYNAVGGVTGIISTIDNISRNGLICSGMGLEKNVLIDINSIKIAVLSYTVDCYCTEEYLTDEGRDTLLNVFNEERLKNDVEQMKEQGADFILAYMNCEQEKVMAIDKRKALGIKLANAGCDYVVCLIPDELSAYFKYTAVDGRKVPIATGLGTFVSGRTDDKDAALLNITIYKTKEGKIDVADHYIPLQRNEFYHHCAFSTTSLLESGRDKESELLRKNTIAEIHKRLGNDISIFSKEKKTMRQNIIPQLTYGEIYKILGAKPSVSDRLKLNMNKKVFIAGRRNDLHKNCAAIRLDFSNFYNSDKVQLELEDALKVGATLFIDKKPCKKIPCIVVDDCKKAYIKLIKAIRNKYDPITVAITGTAGKTTTKELMSAVFDTHYNTLHVEGNNNQYVSAGIIVQKLTQEHEAYVQEVHGGSKGSAKRISRMISPDIALITNIGEGHLKDMGTIENVIKGKMDIIAGLKKDGVLIIDDDNQYLHEQHPDCKVIRYSLHNELCDYYAKNIRNLGNMIKFQIVCKEGTYDAQLNFQGIHNVSNALGVFAAGRCAGIPAYKIIAGLTHYVPDADKQNLIEVGGYKLIIDSYSSTAISVESAIKGLSDYPLDENNRRIAVIGDIPALGSNSTKVHQEVAERLVKYKFDLLLCFGEDSVYFVEAARRSGKEAYYFDNREEFNQKIVDSIQPGDIVLFKGGTRLHFKEETIYPIFGTIV